MDLNILILTTVTFFKILNPVADQLFGAEAAARSALNGNDTGGTSSVSGAENNCPFLTSRDSGSRAGPERAEDLCAQQMV